VTHEPVEGVEVCAWPFVEEAESSGCESTAADGSYAIGGLEAGKYRVEFWSEDGFYEFEFYDDTPKWSEAALVAVGGGETSGIDAELQPRPAIKGTVLAEGTGLPIEEVQVCAWPVPEDEESWGECDWTASDGSYAIGGIEPGDYKVEFWPGFPSPNFAYQFYDHTVQWANAALVSVAAGEWKTGIDADLSVGGMISGNVFDAALGAGLEEVRVCSIEAPTGLLATCTWTQPNGDYTLRHFPPGNYKMVFSPELREWFPGGYPEDDGYPTQFWNNQTTLAAANVIPMPPGGSALGINALYNPPASPVVTPPIGKKPVNPKPRKKKCPRGKKRKKVKGKVRCVKVRKHRKHRKHGKHRHSRPAGFSAQPEAQRFFRAPR
ncbi:MAG: carboxypeptidase-like regulatory domain-containing protein, partial [Actinomycetota bacterium]|nr:carboxypeptidase-like regulatory domain-containing protein [Actinomycetota bacterium]